MFVGITGHQKRPGISWEWVSETLINEINKLGSPEAAYSSLAAGADQVFAQVIVDLKIPLVAVVPMPDYDKLFKGTDLAQYEGFLRRAEVVQLDAAEDDQASFFKAGQYVADHSDILFCVWDGEPSQGFGGTADIVEYARSRGGTVVHINPLKHSIS
ncbi:hypothetical protein ELH21_09295 [Rhizobium leguminosarum]|uniref:hypothetical protein n=1 Tax=Rhizobium leguminosarum TaxID=384 RepID=UPI00102F879F|nr:hypothetical protein [Rhizobium leguminosarum]TBD04573.1 hypothetical protein ELH21_09295 [Rhizobium leguminosarum]